MCVIFITFINWLMAIDWWLLIDGYFNGDQNTLENVYTDLVA